MFLKKFLKLSKINPVLFSLIRCQISDVHPNKPFGSLKKQFSLSDINKFSQLTGDCNSIHFDLDSAKQFGFDRPIVHGILLNGLVFHSDFFF